MAKATEKHTKTVVEETTQTLETTPEESHTPSQARGIYPTWLYHKTLKPVLVNSYEEQLALEEKHAGKWASTPAEFGIETHPAAVVE